MTSGLLISYMAFLAMLIAPVAQIASIGPQMTEALAGLERTREVLNESIEDADPARTVRLDRVDGRVVFDNVDFAYEVRQAGALRRFVRIRAGHRDRARRPVRRREIHDHRADRGFLRANRRPRAGRRHRSRARAARFLSHAARRGAAGNVPLRRHDPRERRLRAPGRDRKRNPRGVPHRARRRICGERSRTSTTRWSASAA